MLEFDIDFGQGESDFAEMAAVHAEPPAAEITILQKDGGRLCKKISLKDGKPHADASGCAMAGGSARRARAKTAAEFADVLANLAPDEAISLGRLRDDLPDTVKVAVKANANERDVISRTLANLTYEASRPAWVLLDFDTKWLSPSVWDRIAGLGGFAQAVRSLVPGYNDAARVLTWSSSSGLYNAETGEEFTGSKGQHLYLQIADGSDAARFLAALQDRAWLAGLGCFAVSKSGSKLNRSIIDTAVGSPERLVFEAKPDLIAPMARKVTLPQHRGGVALDSRLAVPSLNVEERERLVAMQADAWRVLMPKAERVRAEHDAKQIETLVAGGLSRDAALWRLKLLRECTLLPEMTLRTDNHGTIKVGDVLGDPERWVGVTLADPISPDSGRCKAKVLRREDGGIFINSFAHGGAIYRLSHSIDTALAAIGNATSDHILLAQAIYRDGTFTPDERERLILPTARAAKVSPRVVRLALDGEDRKRRAQKVREEVEAQAGGRVIYPAPKPDEELGPTVRAVDAELGRDMSKAPPMRDRGGRLVEVVQKEIPGTHLLSSASASGDAGDEDVAPPPVTTLAALDLVAAQQLIERYFVFPREREGGYMYFTSLPQPFVRAIQQRHQSAVPTVEAVVTAPAVLPGGKWLDGDGFDRKLRLYFAIQPEVRAAIPSGVPTREEAAAALEFLVRDWMVDVSASEFNRVTAVAYAMAMVQRPLLEARPVFWITAPNRGGGKTTLAHMIAEAVMGQMMAATAWPKEEDERRKALFSHARAGAPALLFDNITTGHSINSSVIEAASTSASISDRVLGQSETEEHNCQIIVALTGNNITPRGDLASRSLMIRLTADRERPEDRPFQRQDVLQWTRAHRTQILEAIYKVLAWGSWVVPRDVKAKSRFKPFYLQVGWPLEELAADIGIEYDLNEVLRFAEEQDESKLALANLFDRLRSQFGDRPFTSKEVAKACEVGWVSSDGSRNDKLDDAARELAESIVTIKPQLSVKSLTSLNIGNAFRGLIDKVVEVDGSSFKFVRLEAIGSVASYAVRKVAQIG